MEASDDRGAAYEVEVTQADGTEWDVDLDSAFAVLTRASTAEAPPPDPRDRIVRDDSVVDRTFCNANVSDYPARGQDVRRGTIGRMSDSLSGRDLIAGPPPTLLPADPAAAELDAGVAPADVVREHPESPLAWATLAEIALADDSVDDVTAYAYARVGYHRSLDSLRRNGWKGHGPVPWEHEPNRGFLRSLAALTEAAARIGEDGERARCDQFLLDSSPEAHAALPLGQGPVGG